MLWFLIIPLPNANNVEVPPAVAAALLPRPSPRSFPRADVPPVAISGGRLMELSHVGNLPQRIPIVLRPGLIAAAAIGPGRHDSPSGFGSSGHSGLSERLALDYGLGTSILGRVDDARRGVSAGSSIAG